MKPAGLAAFAARIEAKSRIYVYENAPLELSESLAKRIQRNKAAWKFLQAQAPWYRKRMAYWVSTAKKEETCLRRLEKLIQASAAGRML